MSGKVFIHVDGELLRDLYEVQRLTTRQIAARTGVSFRTILRRLQKFGITPREPGPERHEKLRDGQWLKSEYEKKSCQQIADEIGASCRVVTSWLENHGIARRPRNQHKGKTWSAEIRQNMATAKKGKLLGEENPNWRGGAVNPNTRLRVSYQSKEWSKLVRERDGQKCVQCGATGRLHAHHIKPWKLFTELRFEVSNGTTLCPPCHQKAHGWKFPEWAYHGENRTSAKQPFMRVEDIV